MAEPLTRNWRWPLGIVCKLRGWFQCNHGHRLLYQPDYEHRSPDSQWLSFQCMTCGLWA